MALKATRRKNTQRIKGRRLPDVPGISVEREYWEAGAVAVVGVDEVGRGALAGPVTVAACAFEPGRRIYKVRDSKLLDSKRREELAQKIRKSTVASAVGHSEPFEIDRLGMTDALRMAAERAIDQLAIEPDVILLDGKFDYMQDRRVKTVVGGDSLSMTIAAASILAKVARDEIMVEMDSRFPGFGFAKHKGYSCEEHFAALDRLGPSPIHRQSFGPVASALGLTTRELKERSAGQLSF